VISVEALVEGWPRIRADVKAVSRRIEAILQQIDPVSVNGTEVLLVSPYEFHKNRVNTDEVRQIIEDVIERQYQTRVTVQCMTRTELTTAPQPTAPAPRNLSTEHPTPSPAPVQERPAQATRQQEQAGPRQEEPANDPAPAETTDPPADIDTSRQIEAIKNIFDAEEERD
jgi:DNA polymerase III subunit gamma/tau